MNYIYADLGAYILLTFINKAATIWSELYNSALLHRLNHSNDFVYIF